MSAFIDAGGLPAAFARLAFVASIPLSTFAFGTPDAESPPWRVQANPRVDQVLEIRSRDCDPAVSRIAADGTFVVFDFPSRLRAVEWIPIPAGAERYMVDVRPGAAMSACRDLAFELFETAPGDPRALLAEAGLSASAAKGDWAVAEGGLEAAYAAAVDPGLRFAIARERWMLAYQDGDLERVQARLEEMAGHAITDADRAVLALAQGRTARRRGEYAAARARLEAARVRFDDLGEIGLLTADLELALCNVRILEGDPNALACLEALEPQVRSIASDWFEAGFENTRGGYYLERFELDLAAIAFKRVLKAAQRSGDAFFVALAGSNLGLVYAYAGMHDESVNVLQQSLEAAREAGEVFGEALALVNLGWSSLDLKDAGRARIFLSRALAVTEGGGFEREYWSAQAGMGEAARLDGDFETAFALLRGKRDWERARAPDNARVIGAAWIRLLRALIEGGERAAAVDELAGLDALLARAPESVEVYFAPELLLARARLALSEGAHGKARAAAEAAEQAFMVRGDEAAALEAMATRAQALRSLAPEDALAAGRAFVARSVDARRAFADTQDGVRFGEVVRRGISEHVAFLLAACPEERTVCEREAFRVVEMERALATERERLDAADAPEVVAARLRLTAAHRLLASALATGDEVALADARIEVTTRARDFRRLGGVDVGPGATIDAAVDADWPESLAYVSYWLDESVSVAFVRDRSGLRVVPLSAPEAIEPLLKRFRHVIANPRLPAARAASELGDAIFAPLAVSERAHVAISPQGLLHRVPFAALAVGDEGRPRSILERHVITLTSGIDAALNSIETWQPTSVTIVAPDGAAVGDSLELAANIVRELPPLPGTPWIGLISPGRALKPVRSRRCSVRKLPNSCSGRAVGLMSSWTRPLSRRPTLCTSRPMASSSRTRRHCRGWCLRLKPMARRVWRGRVNFGVWSSAPGLSCSTVAAPLVPSIRP